MSENEAAEREKSSAAMSSVIAAIGLTSMKIIVGVLTGSLGILAEAAHSGLDLVAALVTFFAVKVSGRPPDKEHRYGHGKVENLSALFETLLLLVTCVWIVYEAIQRLFYKTVEVEASIWAFGVMAVSIVVDYSRSRILYRAAEKHKSQALEADALHFSTDIWSSAVVILGLGFVKLGEMYSSMAFLHQADAVAAMLVAGIVIYVSLQLGVRTVRELLDTAPDGMADEIRALIENVEGVVDCHDVRTRFSGPKLFVDAHILVDPNYSFEDAHGLTEIVEKTIQEKYERVDVIIHAEPFEVGHTNHLEV